VNTLEARPRNTVLYGDPDLPTAREEGVGEILPIVDPLHISKLAEARDLKFCVLIERQGALAKTMEK